MPNTPTPSYTITQALAHAQTQGLERIDAQLLLLHALGRSAESAAQGRAWLLSHGDAVLLAEQHHHFVQLVQRRTEGEPVAYLTGTKAFYGLDLVVDARVLDPRGDTETLVDWALEVLPASVYPLTARSNNSVRTISCTGYPNGTEMHPLRVVDLGTGSGAVALAIAHQRSDVLVHAVDISEAALEVARANAQRLDLDVQFSQGVWLDGVHETFDLIVANPPYIAQDDPHLAALAHEPYGALVSGSDGLDAIRHIITQAPQHLATGGWLLLEHGYNQAQAVRDLLHDAGFSKVQSRCDLGGNVRCSGGVWWGV